MPERPGKPCRLCGIDLSRSRRIGDGEGGYFCKPCFKADRARTSAAATAPESGVPLDELNEVPATDTVLGPFERGMIAAGAVACVLLVGGVIYLFEFRDKWENEHRQQIVTMIYDARGLVQRDELDAAKDRYNAAFGLVGDRELRSKELTTMLTEAESEADRLDGRIESKREQERQAEAQVEADRLAKLDLEARQRRARERKATEEKAARSRVASMNVHEASEAGEVGRLRELLDAVPELARRRDRDWLNETPLHVAKNGQVVDLLVSKGAVVDAPTSASRKTPLYMAVQEGRLDAVRALLRHGADANFETGYGSALNEALSSDKKDIAEVLLANGADINSTEGIYPRAPLHAAVVADDLEMVKFLLAHGAEVNVHGGEGTPLDVAIKVNNVDMAIFLRKQGGISTR